MMKRSEKKFCSFFPDMSVTSLALTEKCHTVPSSELKYASASLTEARNNFERDFFLYIGADLQSKGYTDVDGTTAL